MNQVKPLKSPQPELLDYIVVNLVFSRESVYSSASIRLLIDRWTYPSPQDVPSAQLGMLQTPYFSCAETNLTRTLLISAVSLAFLEIR